MEGRSSVDQDSKSTAEPPDRTVFTADILADALLLGEAMRTLLTVSGGVYGMVLLTEDYGTLSLAFTPGERARTDFLTGTLRIIVTTADDEKNNDTSLILSDALARERHAKHLASKMPRPRRGLLEREEGRSPPWGVILDVFAAVVAAAMVATQRGRGERRGKREQNDAGSAPPPEPEPTPEATEEGLCLLADPHLMDRIGAKLQMRGFAGELRPALLLYLTLTSRVLRRPANVAVEGPSAAGKNFAIDQVTALFPAAAIYRLTSSSERLLVYTKESFRHRYVVVDESAGLHHDGVGATILRTIAWDGCLRDGTVEKTPQGTVAREITKEGPTGLITTTVKPLEDELATRLLPVAIRDDEEQTREILREIGSRAAAGSKSVDVSTFVAAQCWLSAQAPIEVLIPFAPLLAKLVPARAVRARRDFRLLLGYVEASAALHQRQRPHDEHGRILATLTDYEVVHPLLAQTYTQASGGLTDAQRAAVEAVTALWEEAGGKPVSMRAVAKRLNLEVSSVSRRLRHSLKLGFVVNEETEKGKPARLKPCDESLIFPTDLPTPKELRAALGETGGNEAKVDLS
jgi:hypothetical protein